MSNITRDLKHFNSDVRKVHDSIEHLNSHSKICNDLVKESNIREASELFTHLSQIDKRIHEVEKHVMHINAHLKDNSTIPSELDEELLDIDDLKDDARHTSFDLKDIHTNIEHLIAHASMCNDIIEPNAEKELAEIKEHLLKIDERTHELLEHIKDIRGKISSSFPEFVWPLPETCEEYLCVTDEIDHKTVEVNELAFKLVDRTDTIKNASIAILCYVRDFITPIRSPEGHIKKASEVLNSGFGGSIHRTILACSLARAVNIPARVHFSNFPVELWEKSAEDFVSGAVERPVDKFSIAWPEFNIDRGWVPAYELFETNINAMANVEQIHTRFIEIGVYKPENVCHPDEWTKLKISELPDEGSFADPKEYLESSRFKAPPHQLDQRLFGGFFYFGDITD